MMVTDGLMATDGPRARTLPSGEADAAAGLGQRGIARGLRRPEGRVVDAIIRWLTGYRDEALEATLNEGTDVETLVAEVIPSSTLSDQRPSANRHVGTSSSHRDDSTELHLDGIAAREGAT